MVDVLQCQDKWLYFWIHFSSREAIEKEQARQRYEKLHAEGKTDEARADLARLAIVRKQREEAAQKKQQEKEGFTSFTCLLNVSGRIKEIVI